MVLGIGGLGIFTIYNLIVAMGQRVYGNPGYLLFAIPTKTRTIIASKMITHFIWMLVTIVVFFIGLTSLLYSLDILGVYEEVFIAIGDLNWTVARVIALVLALMSYMIYYLAFFMFLFALLNLIYKGPHKVLMGILLYFGLNTALSIFTAVPLELMLFKFAILGAGQMLTMDSFWTVFVVYFVIGTVLIISGHFIIEKKMELQ